MVAMFTACNHVPVIPMAFAMNTMHIAELTIQKALNQGRCSQVTPLHHLDGHQPVCDKAKEQG